MNVFTKIALASTGMVEIKRNQAGFILYIQGRANPPRLERFVTLGSFPRWSNILQPLTGGRRNRLTICQIRYKETNSEAVTLSKPVPFFSDTVFFLPPLPWYLIIPNIDLLPDNSHPFDKIIQIHFVDVVTIYAIPIQNKTQCQPCKRLAGPIITFA